MPRIPTDYSKALIYKIVCNDIKIKECYYGSTTSFVKRKSQHKRSCNNINTKQYNFPVYQFIRCNGGWDNWNMVLVKEFACNTKLELEREERMCMEQDETRLNAHLPARTDDEKKEYYKQHYIDNADKKKQHYIDNADKIKEKRKQHYIENTEQHKQYCIDNADKIREQQKQYHIDNGDKIREQKKQYRIDNADKIKEKQKQYRIDNADKIKEKQKQYRIDNDDKIKEKQKQYRIDNAETKKEYNKQYNLKNKK